MSEKYFSAIKVVRQGHPTLDELKFAAARQALKRSNGDRIPGAATDPSIPRQGTGAICQRLRPAGAAALLLPLLFLLALTPEASASPYVQVGPYLIREDGPYSNDPSKTCIIIQYTGTDPYVVIPNLLDGYTVKGVGGFAGCTSMLSVSIPDTVINIGAGAFSGCTGLSSVTIPKGSLLDSSAFSGCNNLTSITVPAENPYYRSDQGIVYDKSGSTLLVCPAGRAGWFGIPDGVTAIGGGVFAGAGFAGCTRLTSVTIPASVTNIANGAFSGCTGLTSVTVPNSVTTIGIGAFTGCTGLTGITLPSGLTTIDGLFKDCTALPGVFLPNSVTAIGASAFENCTSLTSVILPTGVASIGTSAFEGCTALTGMAIPSSVTTIPSYAFAKCTSLASLSLPNSVTNIANYALGECTSLTTLTLPNSLTGIGAIAFAGCIGLTSVTIPTNVTTVGPGAFWGCTKLASVTVSSGSTTIGDYAFYQCSSLKAATFLGQPPPMGQQVFTSTASGFTVYYYDGATGFTTPVFDGTSWIDSPIWNGYPTVKIALTPATSWLLAHGLPHNADMTSTPNGDGVTLLMAYALNLDPTKNQSGKLPRPTIAGNNMSLTYYAGNPDVTYTVHTSTELKTWSPATNISASDVNGFRTATVPVTGSCLFMRLRVIH